MKLSACLIRQLLCLPDDVKIVRVMQGDGQMAEPTIEIVIEHSKLAEVRAADEIPIVSPRILKRPFDGGHEFSGWEQPATTPPELPAFPEPLVFREGFSPRKAT